MSMADMPELGELREVDLRQVWRHEAQDFTPWLAENLQRLSRAVDMELELIETEKAVENFAADILARDVASNSLVLIENQLEKTDHSHLGQILTYLAGLEAKAVIWISPRFQEPHLSAIRWLNDHTSDEFAFFAVRVRAVRIGDSPIAPVFETLARPSEWERTLRQRAGGADAHSQTRLRFWTLYCERHPAAVADGLKPNRHWNAWFQVNEDIWITLGIGASFASVFVRGDWGERKFSAGAVAPPSGRNPRAPARNRALRESSRRLGVRRNEPEFFLPERGAMAGNERLAGETPPALCPHHPQGAGRAMMEDGPPRPHI